MHIHCSCLVEKKAIFKQMGGCVAATFTKTSQHIFFYFSKKGPTMSKQTQKFCVCFLRPPSGTNASFPPKDPKTKN